MPIKSPEQTLPDLENLATARTAKWITQSTLMTEFL
jgi:hypothetical protein